MSLFQAREWWSVTSGNGEEEYTYGAMAVGNLDNDPARPAANKIAVGSLHGVLRIYDPSQAEFKIDHLLMEEQLEHPILQLEIGRFVPYVIVPFNYVHLSMGGENVVDRVIDRYIYR